jgi:hypothetical protein
MWIRGLPARRLLQLASWQVLVVLGAVVVVAGFVAVRGVQHQIETRALHSADFSAQLITSLVI